MAQVSCHKCRQAVPHESDSWCLGCSATEALSQELRNIWGSTGSRAVATDLVVSALRQVRALRRLGLGGAGSSGAPPLLTGSLPPPEPAEPPKKKESAQAAVSAPAGTEVKEEEAAEDSEGSEEEESTSKEAAPVGACPKSKAESAAPLPRRRSGGESKEKDLEESRRRESKEGRDKTGRSRSERKQRDKSRRERRSSHKEKKGRRREGEGHGSSSWRPRPGAEEEGHRQDNRVGRKRVHRGGSRHQRLYRAVDDPYKRFHQQRPEGYWDQPLTSFR